MRSVGKLEQFPTLHAIVTAIFGDVTAFVDPANKFSEPGTPNRVLQVLHNYSKNLRYVDVTYPGGTTIRYIEQNPQTRSPYAARAKRGAQIVWVIRQNDSAYLGYIEDGEVFMKPVALNAYTGTTAW